MLTVQNLLVVVCDQLFICVTVFVVDLPMHIVGWGVATCEYLRIIQPDSGGHVSLVTN